MTCSATTVSFDDDTNTGTSLLLSIRMARDNVIVDENTTYHSSANNNNNNDNADVVRTMIMTVRDDHPYDTNNNNINQEETIDFQPDDEYDVDDNRNTTIDANDTTTNDTYNDSMKVAKNVGKNSNVGKEHEPSSTDDDNDFYEGSNYDDDDDDDADNTQSLYEDQYNNNASGASGGTSTTQGGGGGGGGSSGMHHSHGGGGGAGSAIGGAIGGFFHGRQLRRRSLTDVQKGKVRRIVRREDCQINTSRIVIFILYLATSIFITTTTYLVLSKYADLEQEDSQSKAEAQLEETATLLFNTMDSKMETMHQTLQLISKDLTIYSIAARKTWPYVTIPGFHSLCSKHDHDTVPLSSMIFSTSIVTNSSVRYAYEFFSLVGYEENNTTTHDRIWTWNGHDEENNTSITAIPGNASGPFHPIHQISTSIVTSNTTITTTTTTATTTPLTVHGHINFDMLSVKEYNDTFQKLEKTRQGSITGLFPMELVTGGIHGKEHNVSAPVSLLMEPVFSSYENTSGIVSTINSIIEWDVLLSGILSSKNHIPVRCIVKNSCNSDELNFAIDGSLAYFEGTKKDLLPMENNTSEAYDYVLSNPSQGNEKDICVYSMQVFPMGSSSSSSSDVTYDPKIYTAIVGVLFFLMIVSFVVYDAFVFIRTEKILMAAARYNSVLSSIFPEIVRERVLRDKEDEHTRLETKLLNQRPPNSSDHQQQQQQQQSSSDNPYRLPTSLLPSSLLPSALLRNSVIPSNFTRNLTDVFHPANYDQYHRSPKTEVSSSHHGADVKNMIDDDLVLFDTKPLADLFPDTSVLFADLAGFTAWSSQREPPQVFILLETLYRAFDTIARKRRIFKIETVGDCYVAASGLPDPRKDHAVALARFATDILHKTATLTEKLETSLGPGTADLTLRIGIHSGPVTAGVLRSERSRFQLFGDTMNTASRMESTGIRGKIQCSKETVDLLTEAGKGRWITPREDLITAKGKGLLQTYWIELKSRRDSELNAIKHNNIMPPSDRCLERSLQGEERSRDGRFDAGLGNTSSFEDPIPSTELCDPKTNRLIDWNVDVMYILIKKIVARREATAVFDSAMSSEANWATDCYFDRKGPLKEVREIIELPRFDYRAAKRQKHPDQIQLNPNILEQLRGYVTTIALMYHDNPFHNFEHASHVAMSVTKLLSRIVAPSEILLKVDENSDINSTLHDHTYGITSDPLTQFACVFAALVHDADHHGVPNTQLVKENFLIADYYKGKSVAEQNSVDLCWDLLMRDAYSDLRTAICGTRGELIRFRQLVVNSVLATDIMDKDLKQLRNARWDKAFNDDDDDTKNTETLQTDTNRKATIVIEHIIQASDVAHTMQHWNVYRKWNERLFLETYQAFQQGRGGDVNPAVNWYKGEIGFFDFYIIPLAQKLKDCGVFGVSSDEYLQYAIMNRKEWETRGEEIVHEMLENVKK